MTLPRYGPPDLPAPIERSGAMKALKVTLAVVLVCVGVGGAVVAGVIGSIVYTGCFIGCSDADPVGGVLLGLLAFVLLVGGPWLAIVMWRTARTWRAVKVWAGLLLGLPTLYLFLGLAQSAIGY